MAWCRQIPVGQSRQLQRPALRSEHHRTTAPGVHKRRGGNDDYSGRKPAGPLPVLSCRGARRILRSAQRHSQSGRRVLSRAPARSCLSFCETSAYIKKSKSKVRDQKSVSNLNRNSQFRVDGKKGSTKL